MCFEMIITNPRLRLLLLVHKEKTLTLCFVTLVWILYSEIGLVGLESDYLI